MANQFLTMAPSADALMTPELRSEPGGTRRTSTLLVVACDSLLAPDYAHFVCERAAVTEGHAGATRVVLIGNSTLRHSVRRPVTFCAWDGRTVGLSDGLAVDNVVVFLPSRLTQTTRTRLEQVFVKAAQGSANSVLLIGTARSHYDPRTSTSVEAFAKTSSQSFGLRTILIRTNPVVASRSRTSRYLRRFAAWYPLAPRWLRGACVDELELFTAIESLRQAPRSRQLYTLLGSNLPWAERLRASASPGVFSSVLTRFAHLLALLQFGQFLALALCLLVRFRPGLGVLVGATVQPSSRRELVALANRFNRRHIQVVGYNNGVTHFGHCYPGRTVVTTVGCRHLRHADSGAIQAECGVTIRRARDYLAGFAQELYVVPNYSYVCLGTAFFVPIHGSAADYSTVGETIIEAVFYDPTSDRVIRARRNDATFRKLLFNLQSDWIVLQLCLIVKPRSPYFARVQTLEAASADDILLALTDPQASNVEIRKAQAAASEVTLSQYYDRPVESSAGKDQAVPDLLELPRDRLGRVWDRLEENPISSFLMHALVRHFAWHVELFFTEDEFRIFWNTHSSQPLRKIQLRRIRRDGFPNSPFRDSNFISADLFFWRRDRAAFEAYVKQSFPSVRSNPGKHSR
jgi:hypothetical protein